MDALGVGHGDLSSPPLGVLPPAVAHRAPLRIASSQYEVDVVVYAHSVEGCTSIIAAVETEFCLAVGARLNVGKNKLLVLHTFPPPPRVPTVCSRDQTRRARWWALSVRSDANRSIVTKY